MYASTHQLLLKSVQRLPRYGYFRFLWLGSASTECIGNSWPWFASAPKDASPRSGVLRIEIKDPSCFWNHRSCQVHCPQVVWGSSFLSYSVFVLQDSFLFLPPVICNLSFFSKISLQLPEVGVWLPLWWDKKEPYKNPPPGLGRWVVFWLSCLDWGCPQELIACVRRRKQNKTTQVAGCFKNIHSCKQIRKCCAALFRPFLDLHLLHTSVFKTP